MGAAERASSVSLVLGALLGDRDPGTVVDALEATIDARPPAVELARLLALIAPEVRAARPASPLLDLVGKTYLANWTRTRDHVQQFGRIRDALEARGCAPVVLKGTAMLAGYYRDPGRRSLGDIDVLVEPSRARAAWTCLEELGGRPLRRGSMSGFEAVWSANHGWQFDFPEGLSLDLHWFPLCDCLSPHIAERFVRSARTVEFLGQRLAIPAPEYLLFHACVHGMRHDARYPWRFIADAAMIIRRTPSLHWEEVWSLARESKLMHALQTALAEIAAVTGAAPPRAAAGGRRPALSERVELWAWRREQQPFPRAPLVRVVVHGSRLRRLRAFHPAWRTAGVMQYSSVYLSEKEEGSAFALGWTFIGRLFETKRGRARTAIAGEPSLHARRNDT